MVEVEKLGASSPAAGEVLAAVVNPDTAAPTLSAAASAAPMYCSKVTGDSRRRPPALISRVYGSSHLLLVRANPNKGPVGTLGHQVQAVGKGMSGLDVTRMSSSGHCRGRTVWDGYRAMLYSACWGLMLLCKILAGVERIEVILG